VAFVADFTEIPTLLIAMPKSDILAGASAARPKVAILLCTYHGQHYAEEVTA